MPSTTPAQVGAAYRDAVLRARVTLPAATPAARLSRDLAAAAARLATYTA